MLGILLAVRFWVATCLLQVPTDTLLRPLRPAVAPADTLVRIIPCPGQNRAVLGSILFAGNAITKERILRAELDLRPGDTIALADLPARLEANRRRLFNLQLFHAVVAQASCANGKLVVVFGVQERWYTFPVPILSLADRNLRAWRARPDRWRRIDYGVHVVHNNFRGSNEQVTANLQLGFNRKYELFYEAPGLGPFRRVGFGLGASFYQSRALDYLTLADQPVALRSETDFPIQRFYATGGLRIRHTVQSLTAFDVAYHREQISEVVNAYNPDFYSGRTQREYLDFTLSSTLNRRNTFAYPLTGQFAQAALVHRVFLNKELFNLTTMRLRYARYVPLGGRFYYSAALSGQLRLTRRLAYADARALGYDVLVRGYDEYVIEGRHYGLVQQGVSFQVLSPGPIRLQAIENPKVNNIPLALYLNAFADAGYVGTPAVMPENRLPKRLLRSIGIGLHLVTYYDRVFTAEYTLNGLGQTGYFFRSTFPI